jgi:hypothetical protein
MKYSLQIIGFLIFSLLLCSCIDQSNKLEGIDYKPVLVIEGMVLDQPGKSYVKLTLSSPDGDSVDYFTVNDATVIITEDGSSDFSFKPERPGYYTDTMFCGKINATYTLHVNYNGQDYSAVSTLLPSINIDSLTSEVTDSIAADYNQYKVYVYANRISSDYNSYYNVKIFENDSLYNGYSDLLLIDDLLFESFQKLEIPYSFYTHDKLKIEVYSITKQAFDYYIELNGLTNNNLNSIYFIPQNPISNISNNALGLFQTSAVSSKEIVLP